MAHNEGETGNLKKIYMIGLGPGKREGMTGEALSAIEKSDVVVGYDLYIDLISDIIGGKRRESTPMKKEVDRCAIALKCAEAGDTVAFVCSGDAGVYGMAGVMMEVAQDSPDVDIEVIPGVTAACSAAAVLGAPLIHDFAVISLSDLLTPWETIEKRLRLAAEADFTICLYNPASKKRRDHLRRACEAMLLSKSPATPCGTVRNIGRDGQESGICTLDELRDMELDMFTTVIIGNSSTMVINGRLVTKRGYRGV